MKSSGSLYHNFSDSCKTLHEIYGTEVCQSYDIYGVEDDSFSFESDENDDEAESFWQKFIT